MPIFNVPPSAPFLRSVVTALVDGHLIDGFSARQDPAQLARVSIYLPTRRACRLARDVFLDVMDARAVLLPRLVALGEVDEDELEFAQAHDDIDESIPPALSVVERRLLLAQMIAAWARQPGLSDPGQSPLVVAGAASALALADDLARVMDDMTTRNVPWSSLASLVPEHVDAYWKLSLAFLRIASEQWPNLLAERRCIDAAARRDALIAAEAERLARTHDGPVIAAGSTGSMPATAAFLAAVARMSQGAIVLPGLDRHLDEESWTSIGASAADDAAAESAPGHPQYAMHRLLAGLHVARSEVIDLVPPSPHGREFLLSEAMRPAATTAQWHSRMSEDAHRAAIARAAASIAVIGAANSEEEALVIAVAMREARHLGKTAALVTPDRKLARRVVAALARWNLEVDDSGGDSLTETSAGLFARLVAEAAVQELAPATLLAMLKHEHFRLGRAAGGWSGAIAALEIAVLRGSRPPGGSDGLRAAFHNFRTEHDAFSNGQPSALRRLEPRAHLRPEQLDDAALLLARLAQALAPLEGIAADAMHPFSLFASRHYATLIALYSDDNPANADASLFNAPDGRALEAAFDELLALDEASALPVMRDEYPEAFVAALAGRIVRRAGAPNARLRIFGPLEARLTDCDRVVLGGLVEGIWPPDAPVDPWLNRPMRHALGLDLPERRIGLSAHDFVQLLGAHDVVLTHAGKVGSEPAVPSRFLQRLEAVAGEVAWRNATQRGDYYRTCARALDQPYAIARIVRPAPTPPVATRPRRLSVTEIEAWLRDPYTIYAKHILRLPQLDAVDRPLGAADRGTAIHGALGEFTARHAVHLPADVARAVMECGATHFQPLMASAEVRAWWWPNFARIAQWFADWESARRSKPMQVFAELDGRIAIAGPAGTFFLSARADRIDHLQDGTYAILDYKTGAPPTGKQEYLGISPQLSLEAAILRAGGFRGIPAGCSVSELMYVHVTGNDPAGTAKPLVLAAEAKSKTPLPPDDGAQRALDKLTGLVAAFDDVATPYRSLQMPMWKNRYGTYDHLARVKEWSATGGADDDDSDGGDA